MIDITFRWADIIDIAIVAIALYYVLVWLQGSRAMQLIRGFLVLLIVYVTARFLGLQTINWLFEKFAAVILVVLIIVFQPELRRALERIGRGRVLIKLGLIPQTGGGSFVKNLVKAVDNLSELKMGALIVIEKNTGLSEFLESGVEIDSVVSPEHLLSIFSARSPLHDGAAIIQGDRIAAAGCLLPLSETRLIDKRLGTRHRAAIGLSEQTDAFVIVVSERSGTISVAENGYLTRGVTKQMLEEKLLSLYKIVAKPEEKKKL